MTETRYAVQVTHKDQDPIYVARTPRAVRYSRRNPYAGTGYGYAGNLAAALTWATRDAAETHRVAAQEAADVSDANHYRSQVGDTVVTIVEVTR